jgi:hypothetical protein
VGCDVSKATPAGSGIGTGVFSGTTRELAGDAPATADALRAGYLRVLADARAAA